MQQNSWLFLAPEYPPAVGGIADYLEQLCAGLARAGDDVELCAPAPALAPPGSAVRVRELRHGYDLAAWAEIAARVRKRPELVTVLQYTPLAFSHPRSLAFLLAWPGKLWVMFHEGAYPFERRQRLALRVFAGTTHLAARALAKRADRVLVSTPACEGAFQWFGRRPIPVIWSPIPSNLVPAALRRERASVLGEFGLDAARPVVGHFSAFGARVAEILEATLSLVLASDAGVQVLLVGQGSEAAAERLAAKAPAGARIRAAGRVSSERAGAAVDACDLLVFPYPDGISSRRTTVMAALAFGKALVTTSGPSSETMWQREGCVALCPVDPGALADAVLALLADPARRAELGVRAARVYAERFSLERLVKALRALRGAA